MSLPTSTARQAAFADWKRWSETAYGRFLIFIAFLALLTGIWQLVVSLDIWPPYTLPSPGKVGETLWLNTTNGRLPQAIGISLQRLAIGYVISVAIGTLLGSLTATYKIVDNTAGTLILGMQSLPSVAWLPLAVLWFGLNEQAIIFVVLMGSLFAVAISTRSGIKNIPPIFNRVGQTYGANRWQMYWHIVLPGMMPALAAGLKLGWSFAWRGLMAGELLFIGLGLGQMMSMGRDLNDMSLVLATMLVVIILGLVMDQLVFGRLEARVLERRGLSQA